MDNSLLNKKYHYLYKTTHIPTGRYYIGIHSTDKERDRYMGSGNWIKHAIKKHGKGEFDFEKLKFAKDRDELIKFEAEVVTEELLKDPLCMNFDLGGKTQRENRGIKRQLYIDSEGNSVVTTRDDPRVISGELKHFLTGNQHNTGRVKLKKDDREIIVDPSEVDKLIELGWERGSFHKGRVSPTRGLKWVYRGEERKCIQESEIESYINDGWSEGRNINVLENRVMLTKDGKDIYVNKDLIDSYLVDGWKRGGKTRNVGRVMMKDKDGKVMSILKGSYEWENRKELGLVHIHTGTSSPMKGSKYMYHPILGLARVAPDKIDEYLSNGYGMGMKHQGVSNSGMGRK